MGLGQAIRIFYREYLVLYKRLYPTHIQMTGRLEIYHGLRIAAVGGGLLILVRVLLKAADEGPDDEGTRPNWEQVIYLGYLLIEWIILLVGFWHVVVGLGLAIRAFRIYYLVFYKKIIIADLCAGLDCQSTTRNILRQEIYQGLSVAAVGGALLALPFLLRRIAKRLLHNYQKIGKKPEGASR